MAVPERSLQLLEFLFTIVKYKNAGLGLRELILCLSKLSYVLLE